MARSWSRVRGQLCKNMASRSKKKNTNASEADFVPNPTWEGPWGWHWQGPFHLWRSPYKNWEETPARIWTAHASPESTLPELRVLISLCAGLCHVCENQPHSRHIPRLENPFQAWVQRVRRSILNTCCFCILIEYLWRMASRKGTGSPSMEKSPDRKLDQCP